MSNLEWLTRTPQAIDQAATAAATEHQQILTKPAGSLGQLETLAIRFAGMQGQLKPQLDKVQVSIFAADHGLAGRGVSAFPGSDGPNGQQLCPWRRCGIGAIQSPGC
nr:nicotinate-nucleotide--dimethylbenzimidazole phosphoribosyltransferase [Aliamphritea spongicola]